MGNVQSSDIRCNQLYVSTNRVSRKLSELSRLVPSPSSSLCSWGEKKEMTHFITFPESAILDIKSC